MDSNYRAEERVFREREAASYESHFSSYQDEHERRTLRAFLESVRGRLVDVGCGTQRFQSELIQHDRHVVGLDFSFDSLLIAKSKGETNDVYLVQGEVTALPLADSVADAVVSIQVLEHLLEPADAVAMMAEVKRITKYEGRALVSVYSYHVYDRILRRRTGNTPSHRFVRYTPGQLRTLIREGFGEDARVSIEPQCLFLRRGQRWLQPFRRLEAALSRTPLAWLLASFLAATITRGSPPESND